LEAVETLPDADHDAREAAVLDEHVRAESERDPREPAVLCKVEPLGDVIGVGGRDEVTRRTADPVRGVRGERLVLEHPAAKLRLRGRGWRRRLGRGLAGLAARLGRRLRRYARPTGAGLPASVLAAAGGCFSTVVLSCHS